MKTVEGRNGGKINRLEKGDKLPNAGRKPGSQNAKTVLKKLLETNVNQKNPITGSETMTGLEVITMALFSQAANGNVKAYQEIIDRLEGKVSQSVNMNLTERTEQLKALFPTAEELDDRQSEL